MIQVNTSVQNPPAAQVSEADQSANMEQSPLYHNLIIDSHLTKKQALAQNPANVAPDNIIKQQRLLTVRYYSFDNKIHQGQIVVNVAVAQDVQAFFKEAMRLHFPIAHAIPAADSRYQWSDDAMMADDNSSGFNYRTIAGQTTLSNHALGLAFDIDTFQNPYIFVDDSGTVISQPPGATYNPSKPGTLSDGSPLVKFMKARGWTWGGDWTLTTDGVTDYQHFEKPSAVQQ